MPDQSDPVADLLKSQKIADVTKAKLWDAYQQATDVDDLEKRLRALPASNEVKAGLWDLKQKAGATQADPMMAELDAVQKGGAAAPARTWTDTAVDALPAVGGALGGIIGGAGGTVGGFGVGGIPGAIGGAAVGGAGGEAARQLINRARGVETSADPMAAAKGIGQEGLIQGALEGAGGVVVKGAGMIARPLMDEAIRAAPSIARQFPNIVETAIRERLPVGAFLPGGAKGSVQAVAARGAAAQEVTKALIEAGRAGKVFDPAIVVSRQMQELIADIAKQPIGDAERAQVVNKLTEYLARHPGPIDPLALKQLKSAAQAVADPIYKAMARGEAVTGKQSAKARFSRAVATGTREALETIPGIAEKEARTQELIGATKAIKNSELRRLSLKAESLSGAAAALGGILGPKDDSVSDNVKHAATAWLVTRGLMSPRSTSRIALALTQPQMKALFAQFPRLAYAVAEQLSTPQASTEPQTIEEPTLGQ